MYEKKEYIKRIKKLEPLAVKCLTKKSPEETREIAINMGSEDAYIFGILIGGMMNMARERHVDIIEVESFDGPLKYKRRRKNNNIEEKSEKEIEEKSEKEIEEKSEKEIEEKSEKEIEEKSEKEL